MQTACVTGADRGLGLGLVKQLLKQGYQVFAGKFDQRWNELEELRVLYPEKLVLVDLDIGDDSSVKAASQFISGQTDGLDVIINNGAILGEIQATILDELDFTDMQTVFNITALGALRVSQALIPLLLLGNKKLIVNISSEAGSISESHRKNWFGYSMAKAAVNMQSTIIHNQLKPLGGQVMVIHPGWVKSYMKGTFSSEADITADQSAQHIMFIVDNAKQYLADKPVFVDYLGTEMAW